MVAIAWSPPGLAKHKRSALAVLTSNLILSLWDPGPNPTETSSWKRATVVNGCLEKFFADLKVPESSLRRRRRIRSVGWATAIPNIPKWKQALGFMLAVINDHHEVMFLNISSSSQLKGDSTKVLGHHEHVPANKKSRQCAYEVSWSSWIPCENSIQAFISGTIGGCSSAIQLDVKRSQVCQSCNKVYLRDSASAYPPQRNLVSQVVQRLHHRTSKSSSW